MADISKTVKDLRDLVEFHKGSDIATLETSTLLQSRVSNYLMTVSPSKLHKSDDCTWDFVLCCLDILDRLYSLLPRSCSSTDIAETPSNSEPLLSVYQRQLVTSALQFVVCLGIYPLLDGSVGLPLSLRLEYSEQFSCPNRSKDSNRLDMLAKIASCLYSLVSCPELADLVISGHLIDLLSSLLQLGFGPGTRNILANPSLPSCLCAPGLTARKTLHTLVHRLAPSTVISELLLLQGCGFKGSKEKPLVRTPAWLRRAIGCLLTEQVMRPQGLLHLIGCFIQRSGGHVTGEGCSAVARIIGQWPQRVQPEEYCAHIAPQILEAFSKSCQEQHFSVYRQIAVETIHNLCTSKPVLGREHFLTLIFQPFFSLTRVQETHEDGAILLSAGQLEDSVNQILKLTQVRECSPIVLEEYNRYVDILFSVLTALQDSPLKIRTDLLAVISWILKHSEVIRSLNTLQHLAGLAQSSNISTQPPHSRITLPNYVTFQLLSGTETGLSAVYCRELGEQSDATTAAAVSTNSADCLSGVLQALSGTKLLGEFFLFLLKSLNSLVSEATPDPDASCPTALGNPSSDPLASPSSLLRRLGLAPPAEEEARNRQIRRYRQGMTVLSLLATIFEKIEGEDCLPDTEQIVFFAQHTLSRCVYVLQRSTEAATLTLESETVSMALALLTHQLTKKQLSDNDKQLLNSVLPVLSDLSTAQLAPEIREMAADIRIAIATRCAVLSERLLGQANKVDSMQSGSSKVLIEELPDSTEDRKDLETALEELCDPLIPVRGHALITLNRMVDERRIRTSRDVELLVKIFSENMVHADSYIFLPSIQGLARLGERDPERVLPLLVRGFHDASGSIQGRLKTGEVLVRVTRGLGAFAPKYRDMLLSNMLIGAKDSEELIRAASLSNLADLCGLLKFSLANCLFEILTVAIRLLQNDKSDSVRQAAALLLTQLISGCGDDVVPILGDSLPSIYRALRDSMTTESNLAVRLHVDLALQEIDRVMKRFAFPDASCGLQKDIRILP